MSLELTVEGQNQIALRLKELGESGKHIAGAWLFAEAELIMTDSKENYVPVRDGILRASGHVLPAEINGDEVTVQMGYGGAAAAYAIVQHENLNFNHPNGGQAKFLERPLLAAVRGMGERAIQAFRDWR